MKIKAWGSVLLLSCLCSAVTAQNGNRYLEKPLPRGWGNTVVPNSKTVPTSTGTVNSTTASADDNLFSGQILPVDDQWWKAFNDPVLDSLISVASGENYSVLAAIDRMEQARASLRMERSNFFPSISLMVDGSASKVVVTPPNCPNPSHIIMMRRSMPVGNWIYSEASGNG